jgi:hypothetical protein
VFSIVGYPHDGKEASMKYPDPFNIIVRKVILGKDGVLEGLKSGGVVIDMTTSEPSLAQVH